MQATFHYKLNVEKTLALRVCIKNMAYIAAHSDVVDRLGNPGVSLKKQSGGEFEKLRAGWLLKKKQLLPRKGAVAIKFLIGFTFLGDK